MKTLSKSQVEEVEKLESFIKDCTPERYKEISNKYQEIQDREALESLPSSIEELGSFIANYTPEIYEKGNKREIIGQFNEIGKRYYPGFAGILYQVTKEEFTSFRNLLQKTLDEKTKALEVLKKKGIQPKAPDQRTQDENKSVIEFKALIPRINALKAKYAPKFTGKAESMSDAEFDSFQELIQLVLDQKNMENEAYLKNYMPNDKNEDKRQEWLAAGRPGIPTLGWLIDPKLSKELRLRGMLNLISKTNTADTPLNLQLLFYILTDIILTVARRHEGIKENKEKYAIAGLLNDYQIDSEFSFKSFGNLSATRLTPDGLNKLYNLAYDLPAYIGKNEDGTDFASAVQATGQNLIPDETVEAQSTLSRMWRKKNEIKISEDEKVFNAKLLVTAFNMVFELIEQEQNYCIKTGVNVINSRRRDLRQAKYSLVKRGGTTTQVPMNAAIRALFYKNWSSEFGMVMWSFFRGYARAWSEVLFTGTGYAASQTLGFAKRLFSSSKPTVASQEAITKEATEAVVNDLKSVVVEQTLV